MKLAGIRVAGFPNAKCLLAAKTARASGAMVTPGFPNRTRKEGFMSSCAGAVLDNRLSESDDSFARAAGLVLDRSSDSIRGEAVEAR